MEETEWKNVKKWRVSHLMAIPFIWAYYLSEYNSLSPARTHTRRMKEEAKKAQKEEDVQHYYEMVFLVFILITSLTHTHTTGSTRMFTIKMYESM